MTVFTPAVNKRLLLLKREICQRFTETNWHELGLLTQSVDVIRGHRRLLRSLSFGDDDYESCVIEVLETILVKDIKNLDIIENYVVGISDGAVGISSAPAVLNRYVCTPGVFKIPDGGVDSKLVALMMPFAVEFDPVSESIKDAASSLGLTCKRADDIWEDSTIIQDVFSLIYHSAIVVCDFSGRNANVLYEAGIAHTLGRKVIPLAQDVRDIPFDIQHHRYLKYLPNEQGLGELKDKLTAKLRQEVGANVVDLWTIDPA